MNAFLEPREDKRGINKTFIIGALVGVLLLGGAIWLLTRQPSMEDQMANILEGSYHEGSPEFAELTKDIIISTSDKTVESPNAFGNISMYIVGNIYNKGRHVINGLEVNVTVVTQFNDVLREKRLLVVPTKRPQLGPSENIEVHVEIPGFDKKDDRANIRWKVTAIRVAN